MLDKRYLALGLNGLARAASTDYFTDGHRGAAIIAAYYLCRENHLRPPAEQTLAGLVDDRLASADRCGPFPAERPDPQLRFRLVECMARNAAHLRQAGHNVIFPTLALRAFTEMPEAVTPARVSGICRLVEAFKVADAPVDDSATRADLAGPVGAAEFILSEFVDCTARFEGRGQGWSGHLLTYGRALLDLRAMGYAELAAQVEGGFRAYIGRIRMGPRQIDIPRPEHSPASFAPIDSAGWVPSRGDWQIGHAVKYPYAFYGLMKLVGDEGLKLACLAQAYRVV